MTKPPTTEVHIRFCPICGATDRFKPLFPSPRKHYANGKECPGVTETLSYKLDTNVSRKPSVGASKPSKGKDEA